MSWTVERPIGLGGYHFAVPTRFAITILSVLVAAAGGRSAPAIREGDAVIVTDFANTTGDAMFDASLRQVVGCGEHQAIAEEMAQYV